MIVSRALGRAASYPRVLSIVLVILLIPATNVIGVLFTGMEHSLQVFNSLLVLVGIIREQESLTVPWWLCAAIICGPLVRYENLALSVPAVAYLGLRGRYRSAAFCTGVLTLLLLAFSFFLHKNQVGWLPTSVLAKSGVAGGHGALHGIGTNLRMNLATRQAALLTLGLLMLIGVVFNPARTADERLLSAWAITGLTLHLLVGAFGWYSRYEIYIWTTVLLTLLYLYGKQVADRLRGVSSTRGVVGMTLCALAISTPYVSTLVTTPFASRNIYEQQFQMHRFIAEHWRASVAVNDVGWTSYRNDAYVLDLRGLASREALMASRIDTSATWMDELARKHNVKLAMIYRDAFPAIPLTWAPVAELHLGTARVTAASSTVTFFALDTETIARAQQEASEFRRTLPAGVTMTLFPQR